ncbi:H repeat-associated protein ydcC, partial [Escherichia coli CB7326]
MRGSLLSVDNSRTAEQQNSRTAEQQNKRKSQKMTVRYYISSADLTAEKFATAIRN